MIFCVCIVLIRPPFITISDVPISCGLNAMFLYRDEAHFAYYILPESSTTLTYQPPSFTIEQTPETGHVCCSRFYVLYVCTHTKLDTKYINTEYAITQPGAESLWTSCKESKNLPMIAVKIGQLLLNFCEVRSLWQNVCVFCYFQGNVGHWLAIVFQFSLRTCGGKRTVWNCASYYVGCLERQLPAYAKHLHHHGASHVKSQSQKWASLLTCEKHILL